MKKCIFLAAMLAVVAGAPAQNAKYQGEISAGFACGKGDDGFNRIILETVHGAKVGKHFFGGVGIGYHAYTENHMYECGPNPYDYFFVPVFASVKGYLCDGRFSPYLSADLGYGIATGSGATSRYNGRYYSYGLGLRIKLSGSFALTAAVACQSQKINKTSEKNDALGFKIGFIF